MDKLHYDDNSQSYTLMEGMPVISRLNKKNLDIVNNETFEVLKIGKDSITVKNEMKTVIVPIKDISRTFNIGFCITTHKSQGETFDKPYTISVRASISNCINVISPSDAIAFARKQALGTSILVPSVNLTAFPMW